MNKNGEADIRGSHGEQETVYWMERTKAIVGLFGKAQRISAELGVEAEECVSGGGSDGNFTAAMGVPTLDGVGGVGEGAHAANESILINRIADRTALLAGLVAEL